MRPRDGPTTNRPADARAPCPPKKGVLAPHMNPSARWHGRMCFERVDVRADTWQRSEDGHAHSHVHERVYVQTCDGQTYTLWSKLLALEGWKVRVCVCEDLCDLLEHVHCLLTLLVTKLVQQEHLRG